MSWLLSTYAPVLAACVLLGGLTLDVMSRPRPRDAAPYHEAVRKAAEKIPDVIGDFEALGEEKINPSAVALLRPNVIRQRRYVNRRTGQWVDFLLVQCKEARDMIGHYPPNCYPGQGWVLAGVDPVDWHVGGRVITGKEYHFTRTDPGRHGALVVCNFMIIPYGGFARDMTDVNKAAADFTRRFRGAAQVQVIFDGACPTEERRTIFGELVGANMHVIDAILGGGRK